MRTIEDHTSVLCTERVEGKRMEDGILLRKLSLTPTTGDDAEEGNTGREASGGKRNVEREASGERSDENGDASGERLMKGSSGGNVREIQTFEELMAVVGTRGRWNLRIILMCSFCSFVVPYSSMSYQFFGATPDHWCKVSELIQANWTQEQIISFAIPVSNLTGKPESCLMHNYNYTAAAFLGYERTMADVTAVRINDKEGEAVIPCLSRIYNTSQHESSVVTEWDLTCERRPLYSTTQAVTQVGMLLGSVTYGYVLDAVGRRRGVLISSVLSIVASFLILAATSVEVYIGLKILYQFLEIGFYVGCLIIAMEVCSPTQRTTVGTLFLLPYTVGYMLIPCICYLVRPWRWLQVAITMPLFYTLIFFWGMPESPRWLIQHGNYVKALEVLKRAATVNRTTLPPDDVLVKAMENIRERETNVESEDENARPRSAKSVVLRAVRTVLMLILTPEVRVRAIVVFYLWAATAMIYYGVSLSAYNISTNIYIYTFLGALFEIPAYLFLWLCVTNQGRRKTLALLYIFCGISIALLATLLLLHQEAPVVVKVFLSLTSKMAITAAFQLIWFYTTELFSTKFRARATGEASTFCRIGSASSPYINDLLGEAAVWGPSAVFSLAALVAAGLVFILPETTNKKMPQKSQKI